MYQAIVFLPLLGAILAALIAIAGARARCPGEGPPPGAEETATDHAPHQDAPATHGVASAIHHAPEAHAPAATGSRTTELITTTLLMISMILSWIAFVQVGFGHYDMRVPVFTWIASGNLNVEWSLRIDTLTAVMLVVVTSVSAFVHLYSIGYMADDPYRPRFFGYLSMFTFAMLMLVTADNLVQLYFGWEGVGLASYLLIGFWYHKPEANAAAIKAFVVNRVGAMGKSAQFLLHTWLPDAMEGPTPVSALIHAATMVTAGVFMVARLSPLFELAPHAQAFVVFIGATTAVFAATIGLVQNDIKRVIAYSTCSQLGYMFVAMGVGAYSVGMFHLFTHAFFKGLLFLGAGSVITAMHHEQDMRHMGGLKDRIPFTYITMIVGTLALTGFPLTAGYFSKDAIIEAAFVAHNPMALYAFICTVGAALLTSFYSWRLIFKTFHGEPHDRQHWRDARESPMVMLIPLGFLAFGSVFAGLPFKEIFAGHGVEGFFRESLTFAKGNTVLEDMHHVSLEIGLLPTVMMALGFLVAWHFYIRRPDIPVELARQHEVLYKFLLNKWYFDEIYDAIIVEPTKKLGRLLWKGGDGWLIDGFGPDGVSARVLDVTRNVIRLQSGYLYHYAFAMLIGAALFITWFTFAFR
jgi:NADH-quinone oxidoreductase subunit L